MIRFSFTSTESIKFTCETEKGYQLSPFLIHTLIPWLKSGFLKSTVSRKPTHRSIFAFQFASPFATQVQPLQKHFSIKQSVLCLILMSSSKNCNTSPPQVLQHCGYPSWSIATATTLSPTPKQSSSLGN